MAKRCPPPLPLARPRSLHIPSQRGTRLVDDYLTLTSLLPITPRPLRPPASSAALTPRAPAQVDEDLRALPVRRCLEEPPEQGAQPGAVSQRGAPPERPATRRDSGVNVAVPWRLREGDGTWG